MGISEKKMQIVINNYFKQECDVNTSIREAFEKGFRIGVKKEQSAQPEILLCEDCRYHIPQDERCRLWCQFVDSLEWCSRAKRKDGEADE